MYLWLLKALYGCVKSVLLWYELFSSTLQDMGFELNPYDECVANKVINGKQCTITWHVDDNKISHVDPDVASSVIKQIEKKFGKMRVTRGNKHFFLGMNITFNGNGTFSVLMREYLDESKVDFKKIDGTIVSTTTTLANKVMFPVNADGKILSVDKVKVFHSITAKLLYVSNRARLDKNLAIAFLSTRVSKSTEQDWGKLRRVLQYLKGTLDMLRTLGADSMMELATLVDASYAAYVDMRSHTGGCMSFGLGVLMPKSTKQKLNTKSSTEVEVVGGSDYIPNAIYTKSFLKGQRIILKSNNFNQDNQSTMKLIVNGKKSCGPGS